jgi:outer membrane receptor protein involved in Fe transport
VVLNAGLRAEYWTPGPDAGRQTLPGRSGGVLSLSPRLGVAYPVSVRDAFSLAYSRLQQDPDRDMLYDARAAISDRQPLGNAALIPATVISYEAAVKHLISDVWQAQASVFYRDLWNQIGAREIQAPHGEVNLTYTNDDDGHVAGFEASVVYAPAPRRRVEAHYTWMQADGSESRPEGDPYRSVRDHLPAPIADVPLSWDRRHALNVETVWSWRDQWTIAWSTVVGAPLPWTPKPTREQLADLSRVDSRRLGWTENTNVDVRWSLPRLARVTLGLEARNLFDRRNERAATVDGYPNPIINTFYDDYGAYRTETGQGGGAYVSRNGGADPVWVPVRDPRLLDPPRTVRASIDLRF